MPAPPPPPKKGDIQDDYEFSRETYRNLVAKSNEAIEQMLNLAKELPGDLVEQVKRVIQAVQEAP